MPSLKTNRKVKVLALSCLANCDVVFATVREGNRARLAAGANSA